MHPPVLFKHPLQKGNVFESIPLQKGSLSNCHCPEEGCPAQSFCRRSNNLRHLQKMLRTTIFSTSVNAIHIVPKFLAQNMVGYKQALGCSKPSKEDGGAPSALFDHLLHLWGHGEISASACQKLAHCAHTDGLQQPQSCEDGFSWCLG